MTTANMAQNGRMAVVDLVAFIVLAVCIGLGTGIALGGAVILLSGDALVTAPDSLQQGIALLESVAASSAVR